ncbi:H-type small acid-soluble spore protein [Brevibacillus brevis]|uniref:H-type small acid-soluble spore protein n=1 Tax=Brevibacillus brevis TaxID=1393 RepID=A0A517I1F6_BREBE|nr:H-type small acid-soluble spore protein [Brevibacillus brevis]QDS32739.1 H-type small acid-soluble spore protein [Brevibacillus brevis]
MNKQRAKEIATSPIMANVTCDGIPVYIQHIDDDNDMARIYPLNQPDQEMSVPVTSLREHGEY